MDITQDNREFLLLEYIADDPDVTQSSLATHLRYILITEWLSFRAKLQFTI